MVCGLCELAKVNASGRSQFKWWMGVMKNMIWIVIGAGVVVAAITVLGLPTQAGGLL